MVFAIIKPLLLLNIIALPTLTDGRVSLAVVIINLSDETNVEKIFISVAVPISRLSLLISNMLATERVASLPRPPPVRYVPFMTTPLYEERPFASSSFFIIRERMLDRLDVTAVGAPLLFVSLAPVSCTNSILLSTVKLGP